VTLKGTVLVATSFVVASESWKGLSQPMLCRAKRVFLYFPKYLPGRQVGSDAVKRILGEAGMTAQSGYNSSISVFWWPVFGLFTRFADRGQLLYGGHLD
jgi:hypothetical protein